VDETATRIFIAYRNPRVRALLRREFARDGFRVQCGRNSTEIFAALESDEPPQLLILDTDTPNLGGIGLLDRLLSEYPALPVVLHAHSGELEDSPLLARVTRVVRKSADPRALKRSVVEVLVSRGSGHPRDRDARGGDDG